MDRSTFQGFYGKTVYQVELEIAQFLYAEWSRSALPSQTINPAECHKIASAFVDYWLSLPIPKVDPQK